MTALLEIQGVSKTFRAVGKPQVQALDDVSISVAEGEIAGLVGESGSGKSTLVRCIVRLQRPDRGSIVYDGIDVINARVRIFVVCAGRCRWFFRIRTPA